MGIIEASQEHEEVCPRCGDKVYVEVWEDKRLVYLACENKDCEYEATCEYELQKYRFTYRDEFTTEVEARDFDEARRKIEDVEWKRTAYDLWDDYLDAVYRPVIKGKKE